MILGIASADRMPPNRSPDGVAHWGGSGWIRLGQYVHHLPYKVVVGSLTWKRTNFTITDDTGAEHIPDVLILQRLMHDGLSTHIKMARSIGQYIINDMDDWYWGLSTKNAAWLLSHPKQNPRENTQHYRSIISHSDLVTVSTPYLMDRLSSFVHAPMLLMENTVDTSRFSVRKHEYTDTPMLGWAGSTAHRSGDIETVASVLHNLYTDNQYSLMHVGHADQHPSFASIVKVPDSGVMKINLLPADKYPSALTMDVGIVPLNNVPFNQAKSDIKGLEYAAAGVPFVAQKIDSYISLNKRFGIGRIAKHPTDWIKHLRTLRDYRVRQEESLANREKVMQRDISVGVAQWVDLLNNIKNVG